MEAKTVEFVAEIPSTKQGGGVKKSDARTTKKPLVVAVVSAADGKISSGDASPNSVLPSHKKKRNKVQVSNNKKPFVFYLNLAKRYLKLYNDVELSALGMAIPTVVTIAEILKRSGKATEKSIAISTVISSMENEKGHQIEKAKIEIVLEKVEKLDNSNVVVTAILKKDAKVENVDNTSVAVATILEKDSKVEKLDNTNTAVATILKKDSKVEKLDNTNTAVATILKKDSKVEKLNNPTVAVPTVPKKDSDKEASLAA